MTKNLKTRLILCDYTILLVNMLTVQLDIFDLMSNNNSKVRFN